MKNLAQSTISIATINIRKRTGRSAESLGDNNFVATIATGNVALVSRQRQVRADRVTPNETE